MHITCHHKMIITSLQMKELGLVSHNQNPVNILSAGTSRREKLWGIFSKDRGEVQLGVLDLKKKKLSDERTWTDERFFQFSRST